MTVGETQIDDGLVRVTRWTIQPHESIAMHVHENDYVVIPLSNGVMHAVDVNSAESAVELSCGTSYARKRGAEHRIDNRSDSVISFVEVELLQP